MFRNSALGASFLKLLLCLTGGTPAPTCPSGVIPGPNLVAMKSNTCSNVQGQVTAPETAPVPAAGRSLLMQMCHMKHSMAQQRLSFGCTQPGEALLVKADRAGWQLSRGLYVLPCPKCRGACLACSRPQDTAWGWRPPLARLSAAALVTQMPWQGTA